MKSTPKETYHVEPGKEGGWQVRHNDAPRILAAYATQKEAVEWLHANIEKQKGTEFLLHRRDGWKRAISARRTCAVRTVHATPGKTVIFATGHEADEAAEKVFRLHARLLAELAK